MENGERDSENSPAAKPPREPQGALRLLPLHTHRSHKKKLLIAGLLPSQAEKIKKSHGTQFDLRFWRSDESKDHLRSLAKTSDLSVGVTSFIGHPADAMLQANCQLYVRHPGGIKTLKTTLDGLLTEGVQAVAA